MYLLKALQKAIRKRPALFTTPGHCQGKSVYKEFQKLIGLKPFKADFSEIDGLDNLQNPEGVILQSLQRVSEIYKSKASFYLINGSTSGIIALMLSTVKEGDKVLIARNAHKSIINALILSGAFPIWVNTRWIDEWNIAGAINPAAILEALKLNSDIKAVWITSPTYEGVISDISEISQICKAHNVPLIVDEAHGALWNFSEELPNPAIQLGADASVQSLHKTASCLTQGAILHLGKNSSIDPYKVQQSLNTINTTSPSYILLASIEASIEHLNSKNGRKELKNLLKNIDNFKNKLKSCDIEFLENTDFYQIDKTKICLSLKDISGIDLAEFTESKYNLEVELCNSKSIMALTGIGTDNKKLNLLSKAIIQAQKELPKNKQKALTMPFISPQVSVSPREAFNMGTEKIELKKSIGRISGETIVPYPPGIPVLIIGELIQDKHLDLIDKKEILVLKK